MGEEVGPVAPEVDAAVDVGSNSVHLLVARRTPAGLETMRDESVLLGLGDEVDRDAAISTASLERLVRALDAYVQLARVLGAPEATLVATEPLRRARNAVEVASTVGERVGVALHILSERQEGELTYLGATGGSPPTRPLLVVDIGGGSTEVVLAGSGDGVRVTSLPSGSARLGAGAATHDPPTSSERNSLRAAARQLVVGLPVGAPAGAVFVGGTATNLARLAPLDRSGISRAYRVLGEQSADAISARYTVNVRRARQLPAGAAIVEALLAHYHLDGAEVSQASLRDGAIIARGRLGPGWLDRLDEIVAEGATQPLS